MSQINHAQLGEGPPVILLHGLAASLYNWQALLPELAAAGFQAFAPDLPGHGGSAWLEGPQAYRVERIYNELAAWMAGLELKGPLRLVGHSLGGYISLQYALRHPGQIARLVLIDPFYSPAQLSRLLRPLLQRPRLGERAIRHVPSELIHTALGWDPTHNGDFTPAIRQQIADDYKRADPHIMYLLPSVSDLTAELEAVTMPVQVIWGKNDLTLDPRSFPRLVQALPDAHGHPIPRCGHQPHVGKPKLVNRLVVEFIS